MSNIVKAFHPFDQSNIICITYPNTVMLAKAFMRLQEFYESPIKDFCGRYFDRDEFKQAYANFKGTGTSGQEFTYYTDWVGFNVPGDVVNKYLKLFTDIHFTEESLIKLIEEYKPEQGSYYIIGIGQDDPEESTYYHELSHAFWYLDKQYKSRMKHFINMKLSLGFTANIRRALKRSGYRDEVLDDEITAYLSTGRMIDILDIVKNELETAESIPWSAIVLFQQYFEEYLDGL